MKLQLLTLPFYCLSALNCPKDTQKPIQRLATSNEVIQQYNNDAQNEKIDITINNGYEFNTVEDSQDTITEYNISTENTYSDATLSVSMQRYAQRTRSYIYSDYEESYVYETTSQTELYKINIVSYQNTQVLNIKSIIRAWEYLSTNNFYYTVFTSNDFIKEQIDFRTQNNLYTYVNNLNKTIIKNQNITINNQNQTIDNNITQGIQSNRTYYILLHRNMWEYESDNEKEFILENLEITYYINETIIVNNEIINLPGLLWEIIAMPFAFISTAFNLTLFPNTPYQLNISNLLLLIIGILVIFTVIKIILKIFL